MKFNVKYFASLRETVGLDEETLDLDILTPSELFSYLKEKYSFELEESHVKVAINHEYVDFFPTNFRPWISFVFIPPVAGG